MPRAPPSRPARPIASGKTLARPEADEHETGERDHEGRRRHRGDGTGRGQHRAADEQPPLPHRLQQPAAGQPAPGHGEGEAGVPGGGHGGRRAQVLAQQQRAPVGQRALAERGAAGDRAEHDEHGGRAARVAPPAAADARRRPRCRGRRRAGRAAPMR